MSVVNKMLQDLETRQSQTEEINSDYQAPPKKQSKLLVLLLLILATAAIIFALTDIDRLLGETKNNSIAETTSIQPLPSDTSKKMTMVAEEEPLAPIQSQKMADLQASTDTSTAITTTQSGSPNKVFEAEQILPLESNLTTAQFEPNQTNGPSEKSLETQANTAVITQEATAISPSFSMIGSSQKNNSNSLKQRITETLEADDLDLARSLLFQLLESEPENIKARKKLASLLFAQGNYAQSKQLLTKGIELHPSQGDLRLMLARLHVFQKQASQGLTLLSEFQPRTGNQLEYLSYRASLAQQLKQTKIAKSDYQVLTNIESTNAKWWLGLGIAEDQLGELNKAIIAYKRALSLDQLERSVNDFMQQRISVLAGTR